MLTDHIRKTLIKKLYSIQCVNKKSCNDFKNFSWWTENQDQPVKDFNKIKRQNHLGKKESSVKLKTGPMHDTVYLRQ